MAKIKSCLVQQVNTYAFRQPIELMQNIDRVTEYIRKTLTEKETNTLALSCFALACELATRFLDDYIMGDKYFKTKHDKHNLESTRCQIALAKDILKKMDAMDAIVKVCAKRYL